MAAPSLQCFQTLGLRHAKTETCWFLTLRSRLLHGDCLPGHRCWSVNLARVLLSRCFCVYQKSFLFFCAKLLVLVFLSVLSCLIVLFVVTAQRIRCSLPADVIRGSMEEGKQEAAKLVKFQRCAFWMQVCVFVVWTQKWVPWRPRCSCILNDCWLDFSRFFFFLFRQAEF